MDQSEKAKMNELASCFMPYASRRYAALPPDQRFSHYTSASVALSIIQGTEVWMRSTMVMNDYSESKYGLDRLLKAWKSPVGIKFRKLLDSMFSSLSDEIANQFDGSTQAILLNTYATCLSEHDDTADKNGRLSMWRAYGRKNGVALILNSAAMRTESAVLGVYSSPVEYLDDSQFGDMFDEVNRLVEFHQVDMRRLTRNSLKLFVFQMFRFAVLCTKHPSFAEEREWRVVHTVGIDQPLVNAGPKLISEIRDIAGVPQRILKIPLSSAPEHGLVGLSVPELIDEVIVGPCEYPFVVARAIVDALGEAGIADADKRVRISNIPLRVGQS